MVPSVSFVISPPSPVWLNGHAILGTILGYVFYWIAVIVTLLVMKRNGTLLSLVFL